KGPATLKEHLLDDFGVTYRYLLRDGDLDLTVANVAVRPVDPLFMMPEGMYYRRPEDGGAELVGEKTIRVWYHFDPRSGERSLDAVTDLSNIDRSDPLH